MKTNRCNKSFTRNETSNQCKFSNQTQKCRGIKKDSAFIEYKGYNVKKNVKSYLEKRIINVPFERLIEIAEKGENYEDVLKYTFEDNKKSKTDLQVKNELIDEILEMAGNYARDTDNSNVIDLKSVKRAIKENFDVMF